MCLPLLVAAFPGAEACYARSQAALHPQSSKWHLYSSDPPVAMLVRCIRTSRLESSTSAWAPSRSSPESIRTSVMLQAKKNPE